MDGGPAPERRPPAGVLTDAAVALLARYGWLLVALGWVATRAAMAFVKQTATPTPLATLFKIVAAQTAGDLRHYYDVASAWVSGQVPYRDVDLEYPPGALVLFALPRLLASGFDGYALAFGAEMLVFDALALVLLARTTIRLGGRDGESAAQVRARAVLAGLGYLALTTPMGELLFKRFDVALAALLAAFVFCVVAGARPLWAELLLAAGMWVKLTPAALVPVYLICLHRRADAAPPFWRWLARAGWRHAARIGAFTVLLLGPFIWMARGGLLQIVRYHGLRGLQLESLPANLLMLAHAFVGAHVTTRFAFGAEEVAHPLVPALAAASSLAVVGALAAIAVISGRRLRLAASWRDEGTLFAQGVTASLLAAMALAKVFSPQYLLWVAPLLPLVMRPPGIGRSALVAGGAFLLTGYLYSFAYGELTRMDRIPVVMLAARNAGVLALAAWLVLPPAPGARAARMARAVPALAAVAAACWIVLANVTPLHEGELWSALGIGRAIVSGHGFPHSDLFTSGGAGHPFAAPEWLSGVVFYLGARFTRPWTLCLLPPLVAAACAALLLLALDRDHRRSGLVVPVLLAAMHVVSARTDVRPQMFSLVGLAALAFALERWRRSGRLRDLVWLVPVQILWANLDGGAAAAPLLLAILSVVVAVTGGQRRRREALALGGMAAALFLATLCNPYGVGRTLWSPGWANGDGRPTVGPALLHVYPAWTCAALLIALWTMLALRWRSRPWLDVAVAAFATLMSLRAVGFLAYGALFGFPILIRSARELAPRFLGPAAPRRWPALELGAALLLLGAVGMNGYTADAATPRPLRLGVGGALPFGEVQLIKAQRWQGAIFNDHEAGGLISYTLSPDARPVIDARPYAEDDDRWREYRQARASAADFLAYLDRHDVRIVLLHVDDGNVPILSLVYDQPNWVLAHDSLTYSLYVRRPAEK